ncbi:hypothetical protein PSEUDO8Z_240002 [Pseudomonas sp. 8Z]|nr:hypothetical protein PSEUDO8Z_240002 [Pseudomonas sp. 8Z]
MSARLGNTGMGYAKMKSMQNMAKVVASVLEKFRSSYCTAYESESKHYLPVKHKSRQL